MGDIEQGDETERKVVRFAFMTTESVRSMIRLPIYRGIVRVRRAHLDVSPNAADEAEWEEFRGRHPPIVDEDLWYRANRSLTISSQPKARIRAQIKTGPC